MDLLHNLMLGLSVAVTLQNLLYALLGCMVGTLIGVLPGIGPVATIAMLLPITFHLPPTASLIMLAGIYYGAQYGGSTTSILVNLPGEASSVVTCLDGYQMARNGRAGAALSISAVGSFFAGTVGTIIIVIFAEPLTRMAQKFGPADYCSLMALGLVAAVVLASGSVIKAIAMVFLGLLFGLVGTDVNTGAQRFTFDIPELSDGIDFAPIAMGLFGIAEIVVNLEKHLERRGGAIKVGSLWPTREEIRRAMAGCAARHDAGLAAWRAAGRRPDARRLLVLHAREEDLQEPGRVRQGCGGRRRGARGGQQRRGTDLVHPHADLGHPVQRGDGADGRRHDHPGHPARPRGHDQEARPLLGHDRLDVDRQPHAGRHQPADDRHVGEAA